MSAHLHVKALPLLKVGPGIDGSAGAEILALFQETQVSTLKVLEIPARRFTYNRPVLREGRGALDGRLIVAHALEDLVGIAADLEVRNVLGTRRRIIGPKVLDDIVLD